MPCSTNTTLLLWHSATLAITAMAWWARFLFWSLANLHNMSIMPLLFIISSLFWSDKEIFCNAAQTSVFVSKSSLFDACINKGSRPCDCTNIFLQLDLHPQRYLVARQAWRVVSLSLERANKTSASIIRSSVSSSTEWFSSCLEKEWRANDTPRCVSTSLELMRGRRSDSTDLFSSRNLWFSLRRAKLATVRVHHRWHRVSPSAMSFFIELMSADWSMCVCVSGLLAKREMQRDTALLTSKRVEFVTWMSIHIGLRHCAVSNSSWTAQLSAIFANASPAWTWHLESGFVRRFTNAGSAPDLAIKILFFSSRARFDNVAAASFWISTHENRWLPWAPIIRGSSPPSRKRGTRKSLCFEIPCRPAMAWNCAFNESSDVGGKLNTTSASVHLISSSRWMCIGFVHKLPIARIACCRHLTSWCRVKSINTSK